MKHVLWAISGFSGVGKDEVAGFMVKNHGAIHTGCADPAKRHMADIYDFSYEQLWGPSQNRNRGDIRYPKPIFYECGLSPCDTTALSSISNKYAKLGGVIKPDVNYFSFVSPKDDLIENMKNIVWRYVNGSGDELLKQYFIEEGDPQFFLSPREALQKYCEMMNTMYPYTWIRHGVETHQKIVQSCIEMYKRSDGTILYSMDLLYSKQYGLVKNKSHEAHVSDGFIHTCFSDIRHKPELEYLKTNFKDVTIITVRVKRPGIENPPYQHRSETEQVQIPDSHFDFVINNSGTKSDLFEKIVNMVDQVKSNL